MKLHISEARAQGYIIDECCNPPIAYKGPRMQPDVYHQCYTELETKLLTKLALLDEVTVFIQSAADFGTPVLAAQAKLILAKLGASK